jgi:glycosyltransferase involved in cell wall biosynthesis
LNKKVTIGLCVKDGEKIVKTAFESIISQDYPHDLLKIVIVDNGSTDNTLFLASEFAEAVDMQTLVTSSKGEGLGGTRQMAVANAEGDYILWVDDDLVLSKEYLRNQVEFMEKNQRVGAAEGFVVLPIVKQSIFIKMDLYHLLPHQSSKLKSVGTGGAIFRLQALKMVGGFDTHIKGAGEDLDISRRIKEMGWVLSINTSANLYQKYPPTTVEALLKRNFGYGYGNHYIFHKFKDRQFLVQCFPPYALLSGLKMTYTLYRTTKQKVVFFFFTVHLFNMIVQSFGFIRAHLDGYGHSKEFRNKH